MDYSKRLAISYYKTIATLNETHKIYLVQHQETHKIYVKKILDVYNKYIYLQLQRTPVSGIPEIIELYEEDNQLIVIERYISGYSLPEKINSFNLNMDSIYQYMIELCIILEKLHSFQPPIIHRDIKPSNIIITEYNHVMLLDFNAAKYLNEMTNTDTILLGTKGYAAPEQYGFGSSTPKTDIYALGILLKELTSIFPTIPQELNDIILKCIQINPADRYQSVVELKETLLHAWHPNATNSKKTIRSFFLPGFRTLTPWKMIIAFLNYLFIFYISMTLEVENTFGIALWVERFFCLAMMLTIVFGCFNYLNIQNILPLCKHKNKFIHYIGIIILDFILVATLLTLMMVIELIFFM